MIQAADRQKMYADIVLQLAQITRAIGAISEIILTMSVQEQTVVVDEFQHAKPSFIITYILQVADGQAMTAEAIAGHYAQVKNCSKKKAGSVVRTTLYNLKRQKKLVHNKSAGTYTLAQGTTRAI